MVPHSLNIAYSDGSSQILWEDSERVLHRGWRLDDGGSQRLEIGGFHLRKRDVSGDSDHDDGREGLF